MSSRDGALGRVAGPALRATAGAVLLAAALALPPALPADTFTYAGDAMSTTLASGAEHAVLRGNARVETEDMRITASEIELFGKDFIYALCKGSVHLVDARRGIELTANEVFYNRRDKIARVTGAAVMADLKNEMVVKGGFMEDRDSEGLTVVQIGVRILKKDLVCRAEFAKYWRDRKLLELSGMPVVTRKGDTYQAARIVVDLDTDEMTFEGEVKGSLETKEEKTEEPAQPAAPDQQAEPAQPAAPGQQGEPSGQEQDGEAGGGQ